MIINYLDTFWTTYQKYHLEKAYLHFAICTYQIMYLILYKQHKWTS